MAWWGVALVNGPRFNNPSVDETHAKRACEALQKAREVEKALVEALGARYAWPQPGTAEVVAVALPCHDGEIAYRRGDIDTAVRRLSEAVRLEDELKSDEPPAWAVPPRHAPGAVLLEAKRPAEAEAVYRKDLAKYPENGWTLRGLATALRMKKEVAEAAAVERRFEAAWARASVEPGRGGALSAL